TQRRWLGRHRHHAEHLICHRPRAGGSADRRLAGLRRRISEGREVPPQHATGGRLLVCPQPLHDLPALFRFRLPARLRSMDLRRRHQLGNSRPLAGRARVHPKRRQRTVNGRRAVRKGRPLLPSAWTAKSKELSPSAWGRMVAIYRPILQWGPPLDEGLGVRWTGLHFFFSFELSYLKAAKKSSLAGVPELGTKTSCLPHFHCAIWSCVVFSDSPRHRIESGRHWPVK